MSPKPVTIVVYEHANLENVVFHSNISDAWGRFCFYAINIIHNIMRTFVFGQRGINVAAFTKYISFHRAYKYNIVNTILFQFVRFAVQNVVRFTEISTQNRIFPLRLSSCENILECFKTTWIILNNSRTVNLRASHPRIVFHTAHDYYTDTHNIHLECTKAIIKMFYSFIMSRLYTYYTKHNNILYSHQGLAEV